MRRDSFERCAFKVTGLAERKAKWLQLLVDMHASKYWISFRGVTDYWCVRDIRSDEVMLLRSRSLDSYLQLMLLKHVDSSRHRPWAPSHSTDLLCSRYLNVLMWEMMERLLFATRPTPANGFRRRESTSTRCRSGTFSVVRV